MSYSTKRLSTAPAYFTDLDKVPEVLRDHFDKGGQLFQVERFNGKVLLSTTPDMLEHPDTKLLTAYANFLSMTIMMLQDSLQLMTITGISE